MISTQASSFQQRPLSFTLNKPFNRPEALRKLQKTSFVSGDKRFDSFETTTNRYYSHTHSRSMLNYWKVFEIVFLFFLFFNSNENIITIEKFTSTFSFKCDHEYDIFESKTRDHLLSYGEFSVLGFYFTQGNTVYKKVQFSRKKQKTIRQTN